MVVLPEAKQGEYLTDHLTDQGMRFIEDNRDGPFFLNFWHYAVHGPWGHKEEYTKQFAAKTDPRGQQKNPIMASMLKSVDESLGRVLDKLDELGSIQWPCNDAAEFGTPTMHIDEFVRGKGFFALTEYVPTDERANRRFPLLLTTGRILTQYNVGAQTRRTANSAWHPEDVLEIHPFDAEERGIGEGDWVGITSRVGNTVLRAAISERVRPGVVYTTFHHPVSGANVVTTENSDWATNCPEYKVTAVQVSHVSEPSEWQKEYRSFASRQEELLDKARA